MRQVGGSGEGGQDRCMDVSLLPGHWFSVLFMGRYTTHKKYPWKQTHLLLNLKHWTQCNCGPVKDEDQ